MSVIAPAVPRMEGVLGCPETDSLTPSYFRRQVRQKDVCFVARYVTIALKAMFLAVTGGLCRYPDVQEQTWGEGRCRRADAPCPVRQGVRT